MSETMKERVRASFGRQKFMTLLGAQMEKVEEGCVVVSCECRDELTQQSGILHGGVTSAVAEAACGHAALSVLPENYDMMGVEFKVSLMRPALSGKIYAVAKVTKSGRTLIFTEADVFDAGSKNIIAKMMTTIIAVAPKK